MNDNDFFQRQQAAVDRMREMNSRSKFNTPESPKPNNNPPERQNTPKKQNPPQRSNHNNGFNLPILDNLLRDGDSTLILGLLLLLMSEKADKTLLFALVYILL